MQGKDYTFQQWMRWHVMTINTEEVIKSDLEEIIKEIEDVGLSDISLSRAEVMALIVRFYGAVITAVQYMVITPEEARFLHVWLANNLEL
jgi:hypothetical protein